MHKFKIKGDHDPKTNIYRGYTIKERSEARRLVEALDEGFADFTLEYCRRILPLVISIIHDRQKPRFWPCRHIRLKKARNEHMYWFDLNNQNLSMRPAVRFCQHCGAMRPLTK